MDALDTLIAEKRLAIRAVEAEIADHEAKVANLRESILLATVELAAFEKAASLRPLSAVNGDDASDTSDGDGKRRGRQRGSISRSWRKTLGYLNLTAEPFDYEMMMSAAQSAGINVQTIASIRDRARDYVNQGFLEGTPEDGFQVTKKAVDMFKLDQAPAAGHGGHSPEVPEIEEEEEDDASDDETLREQGATGETSFFGDSDGGGMAS